MCWKSISYISSYQDQRDDRKIGWKKQKNNTPTRWPTRNLSADFEQNCLTGFDRRHSQEQTLLFLFALLCCDSRCKVAVLFGCSGLFRSVCGARQVPRCWVVTGEPGSLRPSRWRRKSRDLSLTCWARWAAACHQIPAQFHRRGRQSRAADPLLFYYVPDIQGSPSAFSTCLSHSLSVLCSRSTSKRMMGSPTTLSGKEWMRNRRGFCPSTKQLASYTSMGPWTMRKKKRSRSVVAGDFAVELKLKMFSVPQCACCVIKMITEQFYVDCCGNIVDTMS